MQGFGELVGEHIDRDNRGRFGVLEEMRHLMRGVERIDIHQHAAGFENPKGDDRIGESVWNLDRHPGSRLQTQSLAQIGGEIVRIAVHFSKAQAGCHAVRHQCRKRLGGGFARRQIRGDAAQHFIRWRLDRLWNAGGIGRKPWETRHGRLPAVGYLLVHRRFP